MIENLTEIRMDYDPDEDYKLDSDVELLASKNNCSVVRANNYTLQLDIDGGEEALEEVKANVKMFERYVQGLGEYTIWRSANGNHHMTIPLHRPLEEKARILLQALLGSDPKREILNYARAVRNMPDAVVLFKPRGDKQSRLVYEDEPFLDDLPY